MEIKTKFNIGDNAWTVKGCKVVEIEISAINIDATSVRYINRSDFTSHLEQDCFSTKEALVKYLLSDGNENV